MKSKFQETDGKVFTEQTVQQFKNLVQPSNYELLRFFLCNPDHADHIDGFAEHRKVLYFTMDDKVFPIRSKSSLQMLTITQDQFNEILLNFANWNGMNGVLSIIKKSDFDCSMYPDQDNIGEFDELYAEFEPLCQACKEDEMVVFDYVQADELDILQHLNAKMIEYAEENSEDEYWEDEEYQHLSSLKDIVMQNLE